MANNGGANFAEPAAPTAGGDAAAVAPAEAAVAPAEPAAPAEAPAAAPTQAVAPAAEPAPAAATVAAGAGEALYKQACAVCHATGVAGAPKFGDKAAWGPRLVAGLDGLTTSAIKGKGAMPPKGGSTASEADIKAAVAYMMDAVK